MEPGDAWFMAGTLMAVLLIVRAGGLALLGLVGWAAVAWALLQADRMQALAFWFALPAICVLFDAVRWGVRRRISRSV